MEYYLDNAATTKISESALKAYIDTATTYFANPSTNYKAGQNAKLKLEETRDEIAKILDVSSNYIYFTSGGSESNSIILSSLLWNNSPGEVIISKIEHASNSEFARILKEKGWKVSTIDAPQGFINPNKLKSMMNDRVRMVCLQYVNNVIGSIQNIEELVKIVRLKEKEYNRKIHFHTDAVQALAKIPFSLKELDVDSASFSAHKFHGPRGVGILYTRLVNQQPLSKAGGQERGVRGGTENLPAIVAMSVALKEQLGTTTIKPSCYDRIYDLNLYLRNNLHTHLLSPRGNYSPYILAFSVAPFPSEVFTRMLNDKGFYVSSGSACSNNVKAKGESILKAMNYSSELSKGSIRISLCDKTTKEEIVAVVNEINNLYDSVVR
ncbi:MAG: cysteine desulfurase [Spirochaetaceae bacterium]|nr:cysteine desulfurase [Spirochaetaceae bacterium]